MGQPTESSSLSPSASFFLPWSRSNTSPSVILFKNMKITSIVIALILITFGVFYYLNTVGKQSRPYVAVGDKLGSMTVVSAAPLNPEYPKGRMGVEVTPDNAHIVLKGPIEVTGKYTGHYESAMGYDGYCMSDFDAESLTRLPTLPNAAPVPYPWFCFSNSEVARRQLGEKEAQVTIIIDNYDLKSYPSEVIDTADFVSVVHM